jgi:hypothetical protein
VQQLVKPAHRAAGGIAELDWNSLDVTPLPTLPAPRAWSMFDQLKHYFSEDKRVGLWAQPTSERVPYRSKAEERADALNMRVTELEQQLETRDDGSVAGGTDIEENTVTPARKRRGRPKKATLPSKRAAVPMAASAASASDTDDEWDDDRLESIQSYRYQAKVKDGSDDESDASIKSVASFLKSASAGERDEGGSKRKVRPTERIRGAAAASRSSGEDEPE